MSVMTIPASIERMGLDGTFEQGIEKMASKMADLDLDEFEMEREAREAFLGLSDALSIEVFEHSDESYSVRVLTGYGVYGGAGHVWFEVSDDGTIIAQDSEYGEFYNPALAREMMREYRQELWDEFDNPIPAV